MKLHVFLYEEVIGWEIHSLRIPSHLCHHVREFPGRPLCCITQSDRWQILNLCKDSWLQTTLTSQWSLRKLKSDFGKCTELLLSQLNAGDQLHQYMLVIELSTCWRQPDVLMQLVDQEDLLYLVTVRTSVSPTEF